MPKQPVVSGYLVIKLLSSIGYVCVRQKGSHITLKKSTVTGEHVIVVPLHDELDKGTLNNIISRVSERNHMSKDLLLEMFKDI